MPMLDNNNNYTCQFCKHSKVEFNADSPQYVANVFYEMNRPLVCARNTNSLLSFNSRGKLVLWSRDEALGRQHFYFEKLAYDQFYSTLMSEYVEKVFNLKTNLNSTSLSSTLNQSSSAIEEHNYIQAIYKNTGVFLIKQESDHTKTGNKERKKENSSGNSYSYMHFSDTGVSLKSHTDLQKALKSATINDEFKQFLWIVELHGDKYRILNFKTLKPLVGNMSKKLTKEKLFVDYNPLSNAYIMSSRPNYSVNLGLWQIKDVVVHHLEYVSNSNCKPKSFVSPYVQYGGNNKISNSNVNLNMGYNNTGYNNSYSNYNDSRQYKQYLSQYSRNRNKQLSANNSINSNNSNLDNDNQDNVHQYEKDYKYDQSYNDNIIKPQQPYSMTSEPGHPNDINSNINNNNKQNTNFNPNKYNYNPETIKTIVQESKEEKQLKSKDKIKHKYNLNSLYYQDQEKTEHKKIVLDNYSSMLYTWFDQPSANKYYEGYPQVQYTQNHYQYQNHPSYQNNSSMSNQFQLSNSVFQRWAPNSSGKQTVQPIYIPISDMEVGEQQNQPNFYDYIYNRDERNTKLQTFNDNSVYQDRDHEINNIKTDNQDQDQDQDRDRDQYKGSEGSSKAMRFKNILKYKIAKTQLFKNNMMKQINLYSENNNNQIGKLGSVLNKSINTIKVNFDEPPITPSTNTGVKQKREDNKTPLNPKDLKSDSDQQKKLELLKLQDQVQKQNCLKLNDNACVNSSFTDDSATGSTDIHTSFAECNLVISVYSFINHRKFFTFDLKKELENVSPNLPFKSKYEEHNLVKNDDSTYFNTLENKDYIMEVLKQRKIQKGKCKKAAGIAEPEGEEEKKTAEQQDMAWSLSGVGKASLSKEVAKWRIDVIDQLNIRVMLMTTDCEGSCHLQSYRVNLCANQCQLASDYDFDWQISYGGIWKYGMCV